MRSHILLITLDQWRYDAAGFAGAAYAQTPTLDAVASRGTVFDAAYTSCPVCVPARASLISGRYGHQFGWRPAAQWIPAQMPTIPRLLNAAGYRTAAVGKMHFMPMGERYGFQDAHLAEHGTPDYYHQDDYHPWLAEQGYDDTFELWQFPRNYHLASDAFRANLQALPSPLPERVYSTTWIGERAVQLVEGHDAATPLFMWLSFLKPHHPFDPPAPWDQRYDPAQIPLPDRSLGDVELLPAHARAALEARVVHNVFDLGVLDEALLRRVRASYFATITQVDFQIGRVLDALRRQGMLEDTWVIATSDHGEFLGHKNRLFKDMAQGALFFDDVARVPLVMAPPAQAAHWPAHWPDPVQHVDLLPTICALADVASPSGLPGRSLLSHLGGATPASERMALAEATGGGAAMLRQGHYKLIWDPRDRLQQLYDLAGDPGERHNLAADPTHGAVLDALRGALRARLPAAA